MTQAELARRLSISTNYVYLIESRRKFPSLDLSRRFGDLFGFNPNWMKVLWLRDYLIWEERKVAVRIGL